MAITINGSPIPPKPVPASTPKKKKYGHTDPQSPNFPMHEPGHKVRNAHFQWFMDCMSHSAFMVQRHKGRIPAPDGFDKNRPYWWSENVAKFMSELKRTHWERTGKSAVG